MKVLIIITNSLPNTSTGSMDYNIRFVFSGQALGFLDGCALLSVFAGDPLVALSSHGPTLFMWHHVLVPGTPSFILLGAVKKDLNEFYKGS